MPFPLMLTRVFLDGGWIFVLWMFLYGSWLFFVDWRRTKYAMAQTYCLLAIDVPKLNEQTPKAVEQIFSHFSGAYSNLDWFETYWLGKLQPKFSFELVSIDGYVQFLVRTPTKYRDLVEAAFYSHYPDAEIVEVVDYATRVPSKYPDPEYEIFGTEFILKKDSYFPLRTYIQFEHNLSEEYFKDPMSSVLEVMSSLKTGEQLWLQILCSPTDESWKDKGEEYADKMLGKKKPVKKSMVDQVMDMPMWWINETSTQMLGGSLLGGNASTEEKKSDQPKMLALSPGERGVLEAVQMKISKIGFKCKMRMVYVAKRNVFNKGRFTSIKGSLAQFSALNMNALKVYGPVTPKEDYFYQRWYSEGKKMLILAKYKSRSGDGATSYIMNIEELATLYHFPVMQVKAPLVKKTEAKRAEPPSSLPTMDDLDGKRFEKVKPPSAKPEALKPVEKDKPKDDEEWSPEEIPFEEY